MRLLMEQKLERLLLTDFQQFVPHHRDNKRSGLKTVRLAALARPVKCDGEGRDARPTELGNGQYDRSGCWQMVRS